MMNAANPLGRWLRRCLRFALVFVVLASKSSAQTRFELIAPQAGAKSLAELDAGALRITDSQGLQTVYNRDRRYDSADGLWLGYYSNRSQQVLRWPASSAGNLQIGQPQPGGAVSYRQSQMTIRALDRPAAGLVLPPDMPGLGAGQPAADFFSGLMQDRRAEPRTLQLSTSDDRGRQWLLSRPDANRLAMIPAAADARNADWFVVPVSRGYVRLQSYDRGVVSALAASPGRALIVEPMSQDVRQLWQVLPCSHAAGRFALESAAHRGFALGGGVGNNFGLHPVAFAPHQLWAPLVPPVFAPIEPFWRTVTSEARPNPPLAPATVELVNSHRYALIVLVGDRRAAGAATLVRIEPNSSTNITLDRDAGGTLVETIEIRSPSGVWDRRQMAIPIPPAMLYDLSVYEEFLQSIAIDRTGASPNPIEDVNYVPKSVGWLPVPPGDSLPAVGRMDVYPLAQAANNPGAVRRFDPKSFNKKPASDPLESLLKEFQPKERRKF